MLESVLTEVKNSMNETSMSLLGLPTAGNLSISLPASLPSSLFFAAVYQVVTGQTKLDLNSLETVCFHLLPGQHCCT